MMHRREFRAMGSRMLAVIDCDLYPRVLQDVPAWFEEWEQVLSRFRSDSELSRLNLNAGRSVPVSQTLWDVYRISLEAENLTDGLVSPLVLDALVRAGYDRSFDQLQVNNLGPLPDFDTTAFTSADIVLDPSDRSICLPKRARLDFGGVAKGWAAHQATRRLGRAGPALVDAGGDIAVNGERSNGEAWAIGVADPFRPDSHLEILYLERGGVATSGKDYHRWVADGVVQHHIINPRTGLPAETDVLTATVVAPTVMQAEAMAKMVIIAGSQAGLARLDADAELAGLLVLEGGQTLYSRNLKQYL